MYREQQMVVKIIAELNTYFLALGADHISSTVVKDGTHGTITFRANYNPDYAYKLQDLEKCLNEQKNDSYEDIFWGLAGTGEPGNSGQLLLVGMMIDKAQIRMEDGFVDMTLYKELA